eukprot:scaffold13453_cov149-Ochromonas_danica.AAC.1
MVERRCQGESKVTWRRAVWVGVGRVGRCGVGLRGVTVVDRSVLGGPVWKTNPVICIQCEQTKQW